MIVFKLDSDETAQILVEFEGQEEIEKKGGAKGKRNGRIMEKQERHTHTHTKNKKENIKFVCTYILRDYIHYIHHYVVFYSISLYL